MNTVPGPPYPGVVERPRADGSNAYRAQLMYRRRGGKVASKHLGTWDTPLRAYYEVVNARATVAEKRATALRAQADQVLADLVRGARR